MHVEGNLCEMNPFGVEVDAPMPKSAAPRVLHKPGLPSDAQGYGLYDGG